MVHGLSRLPQRARDDGAIAIVVALFAIVLFGFAALVVDIGNAQNVRSQSQGAVDAAALAGVRALANGQDVAAVVKGYVADSLHVDSWANCADAGHLPDFPDTVEVGDECISALTLPENGQTSYQVRVKLPARKVPASFAGVFGVGSIVVSPVAVAESGVDVFPTCEPCDPALGPDLQPVGSPSPSPSPVVASPAPTNSPAPPPSPQPPITTCPQPGSYVDGEDAVLAGSCSLAPGLYVFDNSNLSVGGSLSGSQITLVFEGTATLTVGGASALDATPPGDAPRTDEIPGVAVLFDSGDSEVFHLGPTFHIVGSIYALDATWATNPGDCSADDACVVEQGTLSVARTSFAGSVAPRVTNGGPSPSPKPAHLSE